MVKEVTAYTLICDECSADFCDSTISVYSSYPSQEDAELFAEDSDWHVEDDKHYCYDCWQTMLYEEVDGIPDYVKQQEAEERHDYEQTTR